MAISTECLLDSSDTRMPPQLKADGVGVYNIRGGPGAFLGCHHPGPDSSWLHRPTDEKPKNYSNPRPGEGGSVIEQYHNAELASSQDLPTNDH